MKVEEKEREEFSIWGRKEWEEQEREENEG